MAAPFKIALIGAGGISGAHLKAFQQFPDRVRLAAVCDLNEANAKKRAREAGYEAPVFADVQTLLAEGDFDGVDICTTHNTHRDIALAALAAGKHVLVEKPMAISLQECRDMVDAAKQAGKKLMVAQCQRYMPTYRSVKKMIAEGKLGKIKAVRFDSMQDLPSFAPNGHWLCDAAPAGGGIVISVSVHRIDLVRYLVGDIARVTGVTRTTSPLFTNGAEDLAAGLLEFENGAIGEMFATYTGFKMPWGEMFMIFGEDGTIHAVPPVGEYEGESYYITRETAKPFTGWGDQYQGWEKLPIDTGEFPSTNGFINEILHFADCCTNDQEPDSSGADNLGTMKAVFGIYESVKRGSAVELSSL